MHNLIDKTQLRLLFSKRRRVCLIAIIIELRVECGKLPTVSNASHATDPTNKSYIKILLFDIKQWVVVLAKFILLFSDFISRKHRTTVRHLKVLVS